MRFAVWPDGNEVEAGIRTCRAIGTSPAIRSGRERRLSGLTTRLKSAAAAPTEARPIAAARRPLPPPVAASRPAAPSEIFE